MNIEPIAIIGIGCRFPGAINPEAFWHLLCNQIDAIAPIPTERENLHSCFNPDASSSQSQLIQGGFLEQIDQFDPQFFGIAPQEAVSIDPQQRLLLEVTWEALEDACLVPQKLSTTATGVFVGVSGSHYYELLADTRTTNGYAVTGNLTSTTANRISYLLNLTGPSLAINTACSSSLVAVHLACQSLRNRESSLALAAGVNIMLFPEITTSLKNAGMISATGRCRSFDAQADGFVRSEGVGVVVLKLLSQALTDCDPIYAVIQGSAINQDGRSNGLAAPNLQAQQALLRQTYQDIGISPSSVQYVEAQGTGSLLGDAIELKALATVLGENRAVGDKCRVGSVKTNIGHLEATSGIAGLIKVALSLKHGKIPPNLHFQQPNPNVALDKLPLQVQQTLEAWPSDRPAVAGISAFGFGGTNAHIVMSAAPNLVVESSSIDRPLHLLILSAKTETALLSLAQRYHEFFVNHPHVSIANVCFSANTGRTTFNHRLAVTGNSTAQFAERLQAFAVSGQAAGLVSGLVKPKKVPKIGFLFTGLIHDKLELDRQLYETQPVFRQVIDRCNAIAQPLLGKSLIDVLYTSTTEETAIDSINNSTALFALQIALCELWKSWGIEPSVVMGTSLGESAAAYFAGILSLEDALKLLIFGQQQVQSQSQKGTTSVVFADEQQVAAAIQPYADKVFIGIFAEPVLTISGEQQAVDAVTDALKAQGIKTIKSNLPYPYHSPLMTLLEVDFALCSPKIPIISGVTGQLSPDAMTNIEYWQTNLQQPVRFSTGMQTMYQQGVTVFIEIGPKPNLLSQGIRCLPERVGVWLPSLRPGQSSTQQMLSSLAQLYVLGVPVNWLGLDCGDNRDRLRLPTYPFERQSYWFRSSRSSQPSHLSPLPQRSLISSLLDRGDSVKQIVQLLAETESFSQQEVQLLPKLITALVQHHQQDEHESVLTSPTTNIEIPIAEVIAPESNIELKRVQLATSPETQQQLLEEYLTQQIAKVLGLVPSQLDMEQPLNILGLDSLMLIQLVNRIKKDFAVELSIEALFENMTLVDLAQQLQTQLALFKSASSGDSVIMTSKSPVAVPLSFAQESFYSQVKLDPSNPFANLPFTLHFTGDLDIPTLERSFNELVHRHAALRTTFDIAAEQPTQIIHPTMNLPLSVVDLRSLFQPDQQMVVQQLSDQEAQQPFDIAKGPLVRTTLLRLLENQHILLITMHHLITDGTSMVIFLQELAAVYQAFSQGKPSPLPELPMQYADFVVWQRQWLQKDVLTKLQSYWQQKLAPHLVVPEIKTDQPHPAIPRLKAAIYPFQISEALSAQLKALSKQEGCTLFMLLLAALQILVCNYTGQQNFCIGTTVANRNRAEFESVIGCFINQIPIQANLEDNPTFRQVLYLVRKTTLEAHAYSALPLKLILETVPLLKTDNVHTFPLPIVMIFHNEIPLMTENIKLSDCLSVRGENRKFRGARRDLTLHLGESQKSIWGEMEYDVDVFFESTICTFLDDCIDLLQVLVINPDIHLSEIQARHKKVTINQYIF
ncbi:acyltransferase domain-containing protein [Nostoc sp. CENA67]|uniref:Acyltransferase domain-containing protein n=1 Tax=Amazonocrinis nigriterrae CENA67 TaxID=2794033 RepID=A0A8J7HW44_9NOST|nr:type I polyketide synthase [Amazonocrinis nigriterrae]MBH8563709.1 acyltransferase domain-containing protein [Amazonocrinis nigriterrae CENA67]